ncbi:MAG: hypothetical protein V7775_08310 [Sulfitobacter sp.]
MQQAEINMTQADFARHVGVSRAAVSQWKSRDILRDDAFTQPGKKGKLIVSVAVEQVRSNRDIGQALGNGIETRTSTGEAPAAEPLAEEVQLDLAKADAQTITSAPAKAILAEDNSIEGQIKRAKLEQQLRTNRMHATEEAVRQSKLVAADDAREQMTRVANMMLQVFEGALPDLGAAISAQFEIPQRDVVHLLRAEFNKVRSTAATKEKARSDALDRESIAAVELE